MNIKTEEWLPLDVAAKHFGYAHKESLSRRLRQLRKRGLIRDIGRPPDVRDVEQKCVFRRKRSPIPVHADHLFRMMPITLSDSWRSLRSGTTLAAKSYR